jgi:adhesin transport system outer membrane protein
MEANPDLIVAKHEFERQEGMRLQLRARLLPNLTASGGVNERALGLVDRAPRNLDPDDNPNTPPPPPTPETSVALYGYDMKIEVRQLVFDGLSSWHQLKRQELMSKQSYLTLHGTAMRTASLVRQGFDAIRMRTELLASEKRRVEEFVQLVDWTSRKHRAGEVPEFELLRAESELEGARAEFAEAQRVLGEAEQSFRRLLQLPDARSELILEGRFAPRPFELPLEEAIARALANRPDLQSAGLAVEAARRNQQSLLGNYLPKVEVFASYGARTSYYNSGTELDGWTIGALGQWSIFDGGAARGRRMVARAERRTAETRLTELEHQIHSRLNELYQGLAQAKVSMEAQQKSVSISARASHDARRLYEVGQADLEQVLQAGMTHRRAESRFSEAVFNYNSIIADIEFAVGGELGDSLSLADTWKR